MGETINGHYYTNDELTEMGLRQPDSASGIDPVYGTEEERAGEDYRGKYEQTPEDAHRARVLADRIIRETKGKTDPSVWRGMTEGQMRDHIVSWDRQLRNAAAKAGATYDFSDLEGVVRHASYGGKAGELTGRDPQQFIDAQTAIYARRGASGGTRDEGGYATDLPDDPDERQAERERRAATTAADETRRTAAGAVPTTSLPAGGPRPGAGTNTLADMFTTPVGDPYQRGAPQRPTSLMGDFPWSAPRTPPIAPYGQPDYSIAPLYGAAPPYQAGTYAPPVYDPAVPFAGPTPEQLAADPGYQFRLQQGQEALERSGAARGVTNTGGTLKNILDYGQQAASQEYGNVYNRMADTYGMNEAARQAAFDRNALQGWQAWSGNEVGRARAYDVNQANRAAAFATNEANRQHWYDVNARQNLLGYQTNVNMRQQDYLNQYQNWVQSYNQWRQQGADRFDEQYSLL
jgi:hypothetical protein